MNPLSPLQLCSQLALSIDKGYRLPEPVEMNVYKMNPEELKENGIESLPESIGEAIAAVNDLQLCDSPQEMTCLTT
jgi:glutamine synthetase